ncbi:MFS transporter [Mesorhizobium sp. M1E.F.Ca.ET.063.01.1.1]|uniref:MFS transporter n=1 Tax=Mesorhizobium sp. M1E.F.Ca.ET.063.01.1.1 TaxID=2496750 RepID=UPI00167BB6F4|nr:MFS transporter [Mesorhizobium sp. M1E.F.Ca.ET.063.01.1.1]
MASAGAASRLAFVAVLIAVFMIVLDTTIVNVAVPRIGAEFGGSVAGLQWVVNAYNISFAALLLIAGASADRFGAGRVFKLGLWIFMAASLACGLATSLIFLIAARTAQGVGAALMLPTALTLASHLHPLPADRARAFGAWAAVAGAATVLGPSAGGFLVDGVGWRLVFLINIPVGLLAIVMLRHISETQRAERRFDVLAQVLGAIALVGLAIGLTQSGRVGWREPGAYGPPW